MGVDINFYIEQKKEDKWTKVDFPEQLLPWQKDGVIFGLFGEGQYCNGREDICPIDLSRRDLPSDTSYDSSNDIKDGRYNHTYAYLDELMQIKWLWHSNYDDDDKEETAYYSLSGSYFRAFAAPFSNARNM